MEIEREDRGWSSLSSFTCPQSRNHLSPLKEKR
jgi:hypothetical protein